VSEFSEAIKVSAPGLGRRLLSMLYEFLILIAVLFIASFIFHLVFRDTSSLFFRPGLQLYLLVIEGMYLTWFWTNGGQKLPMQTWKLRVVSASGDRVCLKQALARYLFAVIGVFFFGGGIVWALFDRDRQFLHDRLAGTRIMRIEGKSEEISDKSNTAG
jgi:uncharacterized RDD family membrane protein YckC